MRSTIVKGYWKDTGNVVDMLEVSGTVLENLERRIDGEVDDASETIGRVVVERGARVVNSRTVVPSAHRLILGDHSKVQIHT